MRRVRLPAVVHEPGFRRYLAAVTVSHLGNGMANIALAFAVLEFGTATDLGIVFLAREIPLIVFVLLGGVFADRLPRRAILVGGDSLRGIAQVVTAVLLATGTGEVWSVAILQTVFGVANAFSRPATSGLIKEAVSDRGLQEANAMLGLSRSVLSIAGPAIGALIVTVASPAAAIALDALTFFVSAALVASMRFARAARLVTQSVVADLRAGWREFTERRWAVAMILSFGLFQLTYFPALLVLGPVTANESLGGPAAWGAILAVESAGAVVGGLLALRLRVRRPLVVCQLLVLPSGLLLVALSVPLTVVAIAAVGFFVGVGFASGGTLWETALQRNVPVHAISRISSYDWLGSVAFNPLGYALIGPVAAVLGTSSTLLVAGILNVAVCLSVLLVPSVRHIGMNPEQSTVARAAEAS